MKDYLDDTGSRLDAPVRWRWITKVASPLFASLVGHPPESFKQPAVDFNATDEFLPHALNGANG